MKTFSVAFLKTVELSHFQKDFSVFSQRLETYKKSLSWGNKPILQMDTIKAEPLPDSLQAPASEKSFCCRLPTLFTSIATL